MKTEEKPARKKPAQPLWGDFKALKGQLPDGEPPAPWPGWTVKGVSYEEREFINEAARKAGMRTGEWIIDTAHRRVRDEELQDMKRIATIQHGHPEDAPGSHQGTSMAMPSLPLTELLALSAESRALAMTKGCGKLGAKMRRIVDGRMAAMLIPDKAGLPHLDAPLRIPHRAPSKKKVTA